MTAALIVVVTGLSGAGKSTALHALEDSGLYCVDNLPVPVMEATLAACEAGGLHRVALGVDVRVRRFLERATEVIDGLHVPGKREVEVLFLDASDEALLRRFSSTRRPHPMSYSMGAESSPAMAVLDGVRLERERLSPLRARARHIIDTTELSVHDLRKRVLEVYGPGVENRRRMSTRIVSFGFKFGAPVDADIVLDVRFLLNPFFVAELRPLTGLDDGVRRFVAQAEGAAEFVSQLDTLLAFLLPRYEREGKAYLTLAIGCTGGRHRSVAVAEALAEKARQSTGFTIHVNHRDVARDDEAYRSGAQSLHPSKAGSA